MENTVRRPIKKSRRRSKSEGALPASLRPLFWDCDFDDLRLGQHRDFVIARVLTHGRWEDIQWMRQTVGDPALKEWFAARHGRGFEPRHVRFYQLLFRIPEHEASELLASPERHIWDTRTGS